MINPTLQPPCEKLNVDQKALTWVAGLARHSRSWNKRQAVEHCAELGGGGAPARSSSIDKVL
jgi:hypothetical protein